jgi:hypothetical protein
MNDPTKQRDGIEDRVASLPVRDVEPASAERIRRRGLAALAYQRRLADRPWLARSERIYTRFVEPALVASVAVIHLAWVFRNVLLMH